MTKPEVADEDRITFPKRLLHRGVPATNGWPFYCNDQAAVIASAGTLVMAGLSLDLIWRYATHSHQFVAPGMDRGLIAFVHGRVLLAPALYLLAIVVSFVSIAGAKQLFLVGLILYIVPSPLDHYHHRQFQGPEGGQETSQDNVYSKE